MAPPPKVEEPSGGWAISGGWELASNWKRLGFIVNTKSKVSVELDVGVMGHSFTSQVEQRLSITASAST